MNGHMSIEIVFIPTGDKVLVFGSSVIRTMSYVRKAYVDLGCVGA